MQARAASGREEIEEYEGESEPSMKLSQAFVVVLLLHVVAVAGIYGFNQLKEKPAKPVTAKAESSDNAPVAAASEKKTEQPAKSESQPAAKAQSTQTSYSVVAGDTLRRIASKFNTSIESIEKANSLTSTSILKVGQVLSIPSTAKSQANAAPTSTATAKASSTPAVVAKASMEKTPAAHEKNEATPKEQGQSSSGEKTYVVAKGDNPYSLAKKYNITQEALMKANNIDDPKKLKIGQKLVIP